MITDETYVIRMERMKPENAVIENNKQFRYELKTKETQKNRHSLLI
ncbi:hypothetical protein [Liquorilactobacillus hordei]|nr:hypothetical protein [Liquorilactobacillus hordei]QYH51648.1 hypothetical protein G6O70_03765 [Liquorilactobacillus hordei DSM 19519]